MSCIESSKQELGDKLSELYKAYFYSRYHSFQLIQTLEQNVFHFLTNFELIKKFLLEAEVDEIYKYFFYLLKKGEKTTLYKINLFLKESLKKRIFNKYEDSQKVLDIILFSKINGKKIYSIDIDYFLSYIKGLKPDQILSLNDIEYIQNMIWVCLGTGDFKIISQIHEFIFDYKPNFEKKGLWRFLDNHSQYLAYFIIMPEFNN